MSTIDGSVNLATTFALLAFAVATNVDGTVNLQTQVLLIADGDYGNSSSAAFETRTSLDASGAYIAGGAASFQTLTKLSAIGAANTVYLGRPVFNLDVNWANAIKKKFDYNLRSKSLAFALPRFEQLQEFTVQGIEFTALLETAAKIAAFDQLTEQLRGRLNGFWMPSPFESFQIVAGLDASTFQIKEQGLSGYIADHPSVHFIFTKLDQTAQCSEVLSVVVSAPGTGRETVTLTAPLSSAVDETWDCAKLLYVRLSSDEEQGEFEVDNFQHRKMEVIELPTEYAQIETGQTPVYLYEFSLIIPDEPTYFWRFTGLNEDVQSLGNTFTSFPMVHSGLRYSMTSDRPDVQLKTWFDTASPLSLFVPFSLPLPLWVQIYETTYSALDTVTTIFYGRVDRVQAEGKLLNAHVSGFLESLKQKFPRFLIQPRCNYTLFDASCGLSKASFETAVFLQNDSAAPGDIVGRRIKVTSQGGATVERFTGALFNAFSLGWIRTGTGINTEIRTIRQSSAEEGGEIILRINMPFNHAVVGQTAKLYPGCNGSREHCKYVFKNWRRWGGHVTPLTNPAVKALDQVVAKPNKK